MLATGYAREGIGPAYNGAPLLQKVFDRDELMEVNLLRFVADALSVGAVLFS